MHAFNLVFHDKSRSRLSGRRLCGVFTCGVITFGIWHLRARWPKLINYQRRKGNKENKNKNHSAVRRFVIEIGPYYTQKSAMHVSPLNLRTDPGVFYNTCITTPIERLFHLELSRSTVDILNRFWIQVAVSELKRPLFVRVRNRFGSDTVISL
jgi:hypothetical protein